MYIPLKTDIDPCLSLVCALSLSLPRARALDRYRLIALSLSLCLLSVSLSSQSQLPQRNGDVIFFLKKITILFTDNYNDNTII